METNKVLAYACNGYGSLVKILAKLRSEVPGPVDMSWESVAGHYGRGHLVRDERDSLPAVISKGNRYSIKDVGKVL